MFCTDSHVHHSTQYYQFKNAALMIRHHSEPGLNILNELRLTLSSPALKNFKTSTSSVKSSGDFSLLPRLNKNKRHPFVMAKVRFSVRSPKKQPPRRRRRQLFIQRLHWEGYGGARRDRTDDLMLAKHALSQLSYGPLTFYHTIPHIAGWQMMALYG